MTDVCLLFSTFYCFIFSISSFLCCVGWPEFAGGFTFPCPVRVTVPRVETRLLAGETFILRIFGSVSRGPEQSGARQLPVCQYFFFLFFFHFFLFISGLVRWEMVFVVLFCKFSWLVACLVGLFSCGVVFRHRSCVKAFFFFGFDFLFSDYILFFF